VGHRGGPRRPEASTHQEFQPDLLVLDIMMPDTDGFSVLKTIRESDRYTPRCS
jgi:two-component system response regulator TrcR